MRGQLNTEAIELCHATNCSSFRSLSPFVGAVSGRSGQWPSHRQVRGRNTSCAASILRHGVAAWPMGIKAVSKSRDFNVHVGGGAHSLLLETLARSRSRTPSLLCIIRVE